MAHFAIVIGHSSAFIYQVARANAQRVATAPLAGLDVAAWLADHVPPQSRCTLLTDFLEEAYVRSPLPSMWWAPNRQQLLGRRLTQQFRSGAYKATMVPQSSPLQPPTIASLFNLGQPEVVAQWLAALDALHANVDGLWTFASLGALAFTGKQPKVPQAKPGNLRKRTEPFTFTLIETPSGLRQTLVLDGAPLFSRLAIKTDGSAFDLNAIAAEAARTGQYLVSQDWLASNGPPTPAFVWTSSAVDTAIELPVVAGPLAVNEVHQVDDAYAFAIAKVVRLQQSQQLLPLNARANWQVQLLGRQALITGACVLGAALVWAGWSLYQSTQARSGAAQKIASAHALDQETKNKVAQAVEDPAKAALAEASVSTWRRAVAEQPDQLVALINAANALTATPDLKMDRIRWQTANVWEQPEQGQSPTTLFQCPRAPKSNPSPQAAASAEPPNPDAPRVLATLQFEGDVNASLTHRDAVAVQDKFNALLAGARRHVVVEIPAFDQDPNKPFAGLLGKVGERRIKQCVEVLDK